MPDSTDPEHAAATQDVDALIAGAKLPERQETVCLRGDLVAEIQQLEEQLRTVTIDDDRVGSPASPAAVAERIEALREQMREHSLTIRLRALHRTKWGELVADHPPRDGNERDQAIGLNMATFWDDAVSRCMVKPDLSAEKKQALFDVLPDGEWQRLTDAVWSLNRQKVDVPFSALASLHRQNSEPTSARRERGGSRGGGSTGGNRRKSRSTSTTTKAG